MGASASVASMPIKERRELYNELRNKYTWSDLNGLAEEEKQAWLEVAEERKEAEAAAEDAAAEEAVVAEAVAEAVQDAGVGGEAATAAAAAAATAAAAGGEGGAIERGAPEVTLLNAAEAAAARTGASNGRKSGWDLSGEDNQGVRPQRRKTRLSYLLADDNGDGNGAGVGVGGCPDSGISGGQQAAEAADAVGGKRRHTTSGPHFSAELPAWRKTAEEVETPSELCVGDVVRARDKNCNGMWFEGVLTQIHDETTFEVAISGDDDEEEEEEGGPQRITVGIDDLVRIMPWFCIEVGDLVECQPEGMMCWIRGTVVNIDLEQALYNVALESEVDGDLVNEQAAGGEGGDGGEDSLARVPDSRIRKIISGRLAASKRWKKAS